MSRQFSFPVNILKRITNDDCSASSVQLHFKMHRRLNSVSSSPLEPLGTEVANVLPMVSTLASSLSASSWVPPLPVPSPPSAKAFKSIRLVLGASNHAHKHWAFSSMCVDFKPTVLMLTSNPWTLLSVSLLTIRLISELFGFEVPQKLLVSTLLAKSVRQQMLGWHGLQGKGATHHGWLAKSKLSD